jgi:YD repeat-containing protein
MLKIIFSFPVILLVVFIFTNACADNNTTLKSPKGYKMERMDVNKFYKNKDSSHRYEFILPNGTKVVQVGEKETGFNETRTSPENPLFQENRAYYGTGELWGKWLEYKNRFPHGISYTYDKQGNVIKQTNYDEGYIYTWKDIKKYCNTHHIDLFDRFTLISKRSRNDILDMYKPENIKFINPENKLTERDAFIAYEAKKGKVIKVWYIIYKSASGTSKSVYIDARQGNVMYTIEAPLSNGRPAHYAKDKGAVYIDKSIITYRYGE